MPEASLPQLAQALGAASRVLIAIHEQPDADALGSALALAEALRASGTAVDLACADPVPKRYHFLPGWEAFRAAAAPAPLALVLDTSDDKRLGALRDAVLDSAQVLVLDHHASGGHWEGLVHARESAPASAVLALELLRVLGVTLTPTMATCLYCGLGGDTGFFTFQNTTPEALRAAADLVEAGAPAAEIHRLAAAQLPLSSLHLRGRALLSARTQAEGRLCLTVLREEDFIASGAAQEETEGIIDWLRMCEGAEITVLLKQDGPDSWRVSLRSLTADVSRVAVAFAGGGHRVAAGCSMAGSEAEVTARLLAALHDLLEAPR